MVKANRENCQRIINALKTAQTLLGEVTQYKWINIYEDIME